MCANSGCSGHRAAGAHCVALISRERRNLKWSFNANRPRTAYDCGGSDPGLDFGACGGGRYQSGGCTGDDDALLPVALRTQFKHLVGLRGRLFTAWVYSKIVKSGGRGQAKLGAATHDQTGIDVDVYVHGANV